MDFRLLAAANPIASIYVYTTIYCSAWWVRGDKFKLTTRARLIKRSEKDRTIEFVFTGEEKLHVVGHEFFPGEQSIVIPVHRMKGCISVFHGNSEALVMNAYATQQDLSSRRCLRLWCRTFPRRIGRAPRRYEILTTRWQTSPRTVCTTSSCRLRVQASWTVWAGLPVERPLYLVTTISKSAREM